jgi:exopolysaccharide biosynthesis polyprenyl glycosylphosphotransferase
MMKRILYLVLDLFFIYGSILLSFYLLLQFDMLEDFQKNFAAFLIVTPFIGVFYLILMYAFGLYSLTYKGLSELIYIIFLISVSLMVGIMGVCFFIRDIALAFPRSVILLSFSFYFIFLTLWRTFLWYFSRKFHRKRKIAVISRDDNSLSETIRRKYSAFYQIEYECWGNDPLVLSKLESVDEVFITADVRQKIREKVIPESIKYKKEICFIPKYFDLSIMGSSFFKRDDIPMFRISNIELSPEELFTKRLLDLVLGAIALIVSLPVTLLIASLVKLDGGPVFYSQERLTRNGKTFKMLKFRTMIPNSEELSGPVLAGKNDPRITKIGKFMRAIRLDEVPQLINILAGDMSLVGPRPERPFFAEQYEKEIPEYRYRLAIKAGLTGLAQVEGKYNTTVEDKLRYDLIYINNYSILKDFLILLQTIKILFLKSSTEGINNS